MNKHDDVLNELVYQIDDIVYSFYSHSNEIIATKRSQERLLTFREKTLNTINDMNVRSLEIISSFRSRALVDERAETLLVKNQDIVNSAIEILESAPNRSDFIDDVSELASNVIDSAKDVMNRVEASGAVDKIVEAAQDGFNLAKDSFEDFSQNPKVIENKKIIKEKTKDVVDLGSKFVKDNSRKFADWVAAEMESANEDTESGTPYEDDK